MAGNLDAIFCHYGQRVGARGYVRHGGTGRNNGEIVAWHIGNRERDYSRRRGGDGETTAFDRGQVFSNRVHFGDMRAAFQQRAVDGLLVG